MGRVITFRSFCIAIILGVIYGMTSCKQKPEIKPELLAVKETVLQLDSMSVSLHGWEPKDSAYVPFDDSALEKLIETEKPVHPMYDSLDVASVHLTQEQYDKAKDAWSVFKDLCTTDHYEEALANFYSAHNDLLMFLKHSTLRYKFYHSVVLPLMIEFKGMESAINAYVDYLELMLSQVELSIALGEIQNNPYVPEVYPEILIDLAKGYVIKGDLTRGMSLITSIITSINYLTGDVMLGNYAGTELGAQMHYMSGRIESAIRIWEDYKLFLSENKDLAESEEEYEHYMDIAESKLIELRSKMY